MRRWLATALSASACHLGFAPGETGHGFLQRCAIPLTEAALAAGTGQALEQDQLGGCLATASELSDVAFRNGEPCPSCPEGCVVVLLLQAVAFPRDFHEVTTCSQSLMYYFRAYSMFKDFEPHWTQLLLENLPQLVNARRGQCAAARRCELEGSQLPQSAQGASPQRQAVLLAATASMLGTYQPFINLWRCYAISHGLEFILETERGRAPAANWMRWFAAQRWLPFFEGLLIVDPDQVIVPSCWNRSIAELLNTHQTGAEAEVGLRDFGRPQTLNNGVAWLRNSARGRHFLELLIQKAPWLHTMEHDQGPFDETVLEVLGLEAASAGNASYDSECAQYLFPNVQGNHELALYAMCWWRQSEELAGPFGERRSQVIRFLDPRQHDVNHVVGARGLSDPAMLYHFAGRSKDWEAMLKLFGLEREGTADCREVLDYVNTRSETCVPGGPVVETCEPPEVVC